MQITNYTQLFSMVPEGRPVALLIRHGGKTDWDELRLKAIGGALGNRLKSVASSTYDYCLAQGKAIILAAELPLLVASSDDLGNPSILINKEYLQAAESAWKDLGHDAITVNLMKGLQIPGFNDPSVSARRLLCWMLEKSASAGTGITLFISHDIIMLVIMSRLFNIQFTQDLWPSRLEEVVFWREGDKVICRYRGETTEIPYLSCQDS